MPREWTPKIPGHLHLTSTMRSNHLRLYPLPITQPIPKPNPSPFHLPYPQSPTLTLWSARLPQRVILCNPTLSPIPTPLLLPVRGQLGCRKEFISATTPFPIPHPYPPPTSEAKKFKSNPILMLFGFKTARSKIQGLRFKIQDSRFKIQDSRLKTQGSKYVSFPPSPSHSSFLRSEQGTRTRAAVP